MELIRTEINDLCILRPTVLNDGRGYFFESFRESFFRQEGLPSSFVQCNQSGSAYGVVRGLHYQLAPYSQTKLVQAVCGEIWDVAVDLRKNSPSFGKWHGEILSDQNHLQLLIPRGFAHGFAVLSKFAVVSYYCDQVYRPDSERGICFQDNDLAIDWKIDPGQMILSEKDKMFPGFREAEMNFLYGK